MLVLKGARRLRGEVKRGRPKHDDREQSAPLSDVMSLREVSDYLGCSKGIVYRLVKHGEFPAFRLGGNWRFRRSDIDKWIAQQRASQAEEMPSKPERRGRRKK